MKTASDGHVMMFHDDKKRGEVRAGPCLIMAQHRDDEDHNKDEGDRIEGVQSSHEQVVDPAARQP